MRIWISLFLMLSLGSLTAQQRIFNSEEVLEFSIHADFSDLLKQRYSEDHTVSGIIKTPNTSEEFPVKISVRGNYRRDEANCAFPPLWLKNKNESKEMDRVKKIKLVTHCNNSEDWEPYVLKEYLAYKMFRELSDLSYQVRLCRIGYYDNGKELFTRYAFLIEENKKLAYRIGGKKVKELPVPEDIPDLTNAGLISFFQFMIGNTDWYMPDHNIRVYSRKSKADTVYIPYDFDLSGMVNKPGSQPRVGLNINSVRQRYFLGHCRSAEEVREIRSIFMDKRDRILKMIESFRLLEELHRKEVYDYILEFYTLLENKDGTEKEILTTCSGYF